MLMTWVLYALHALICYLILYVLVTGCMYLIVKYYGFDVSIIFKKRQCADANLKFPVSNDMLTNHLNIPDSNPRYENPDDSDDDSFKNYHSKSFKIDSFKNNDDIELEDVQGWINDSSENCVNERVVKNMDKNKKQF